MDKLLALYLYQRSSLGDARTPKSAAKCFFKILYHADPSLQSDLAAFAFQQTFNPSLLLPGGSLLVSHNVRGKVESNLPLYTKLFAGRLGSLAVPPQQHALRNPQVPQMYAPSFALQQVLR